MVLLRQILINMTITAIAETILIRISAEQVPLLHRYFQKSAGLISATLSSTSENCFLNVYIF